MLIHANAGPELGQRRVYLSPATLLVVPGTLIGHWEEQVQKAPLPMWPTLLQRHFLYLVGQAEAIDPQLHPSAVQSACPCACSPYVLFSEHGIQGPLTGVLRLQMRMHIAEGALRVKVLDRAADGRESTAMEVAWHCDLVITTFQRLSVEWSNGRIKAKSIFNQVSALMDHALGALLSQIYTALHIELLNTALQ